ncbi:DUF2721 domain-containing protein [uncultured Erythrobacter sp.]|uniref:DUF2721 domain-containing protein n=1 Tax=uncultured Erythrobacter sp. TaxID=263913 RepID=UPI00262B49A5|nr:DUF2721 domain-containing protein [uncultured Erythrobacter sp.]
MLDLLGAAIANDLLQQTASTPAVTKALQSSLAPAFLLVGIGSIMNVMVARLNWIAGRIERLEGHDDPVKAARAEGEIEWLYARRNLARRAIMVSTAAGAIISVVIALLFVSTYVDAQIGTVIAILWVATVGCLIAGLAFFFRETLLAARGTGPNSD